MFFQLVEEVDEVGEHFDGEVDLLPSLMLSSSIVQVLGNGDALDLNFKVFHWVDGGDLEHALAVHSTDRCGTVEWLLDCEKRICLSVEDVVDHQCCCRVLGFGPHRSQK